MKIISMIYNFFDIQIPYKPIPLKQNPNWNGEIITPEHCNKKVLKVSEDEIVCITPIHEDTQEQVYGSITRTFGDVLSDEVGI